MKVKRCLTVPMKIIYKKRLSEHDRLHNTWISAYTWEGILAATKKGKKPFVIYRRTKTKPRVVMSKLRCGQKYLLG